MSTAHSVCVGVASTAGGECGRTRTFQCAQYNNSNSYTHSLVLSHFDWDVCCVCVCVRANLAYTPHHYISLCMNFMGFDGAIFCPKSNAYCFCICNKVLKQKNSSQTYTQHTATSTSNGVWLAWLQSVYLKWACTIACSKRVINMV